MVSLILIGEPKSRHIPAIAMQVQSYRESGWARPTKDSEPLDSMIGGNAARWIKEKSKTHHISHIVTRNYIPPQTAFYAHWLVFFEGGVEEEFLQEFPEFDAERAIEKLVAEIKSLTERAETKLSKGAFDLSGYPRDHRRAAAGRFTGLDQQVKFSQERIRELVRAAGVRDEWRSRIATEQTGE